jgi:hypothetical protein
MSPAFAASTFALRATVDKSLLRRAKPACGYGAAGPAFASLRRGRL